MYPSSIKHCYFWELIIWVHAFIMLAGPLQTSWAQVSFNPPECDVQYLSDLHSYDPDVTLKLWSPDERCQIDALLREVEEKLRGLVAASAYPKSLDFVRVLKYSALYPNGGTVDSNAAAVDSQIVIPDSFFSQSKKGQLRTIIHELVHTADPANLVAYSAFWIARENKITNDSTEHSLVEELADFVANNAFNYNIADTTCRAIILKSLLEPDAVHRAFITKFRQARRFDFEHRFKESFESYQCADTILPTSPSTQVKTAYVALKLENYEAALQAARQADNMFSSSNVSPAEFEYNDGLKIQAFLLLRTERDPVAASKIADIILSCSPDDKFALKLKDLCRRTVQLTK